MQQEDITERRRLCYIVSSAITVTAFLKDHINYLSKEFQITVVANITDNDLSDMTNINAHIISAPIQRKISLIYDAKALVRLFQIFRGNKFDIIHSITPKAGLLTQIAAYMSKTPIRIHTYTGQVWANMRGVKRILFKSLDRLIAMLATDLLVDSKSQRDFLLSEKIIKPEKSMVLLNGSVSGVDTTRFRPNKDARKRIRSELQIGDSGIVFLYIGRLNRDKGVIDLASAFSSICKESVNYNLLIVGPDEENMKQEMLDICGACKEKLIFCDYTDIPETYMASADILILPSYREGSGTVVIEAAACGIPSIGTRIYGLADAIVDNDTGFLYKTGHVNELQEKMKRLAKDSYQRESMGNNARVRVKKLFEQTLISKELLNYYHRMAY